MSTFLSLVAKDVAVMTTTGTANDDEVGIVMTLGFMWR